MNLLEATLGRHAPSVINVVVEIPKGSKKRYQYNPKRRRFEVDFKFSLPMPTEYGWIPETIGEDGEHLDAMVLARYPTRPGYICQARPIGTLKRKDLDHKVICVMLGDEKYKDVQDVSDLDGIVLRKIVNFFEPYYELDGWLGQVETLEFIEESHKKYLSAGDTVIDEEIDSSNL